MAKLFRCHARITNSKYTVAIPPFEVHASGWNVAAYRASAQAIHIYKAPRGLRDRPLEVEITMRAAAVSGD